MVLTNVPKKSDAGPNLFCSMYDYDEKRSYIILWKQIFAENAPVDTLSAFLTTPPNHYRLWVQNVHEKEKNKTFIRR